MNIKIIAFGLITILVTSCNPLYERGYDPTWWDYNSVTINNSGETIEYLVIQKKGYDSALAVGRNLRAGGGSIDVSVSLPIRGKVTAFWKTKGQSYFCDVDLDLLSLSSYKDGDFTFEFLEERLIKIYLESDTGERSDKVIEVVGKVDPAPEWYEG